MNKLYKKESLLKYLNHYGLAANKQLGQHFLLDKEVLETIVMSGDLTDESFVIEVGPGPGVLSEMLIEFGVQLLAIELDENMVNAWSMHFKKAKNAEIIHQDILSFTPPEKNYTVIANIPYYITSPLLRHFLFQPAARRPQKMVLLMQKEVAEKIVNKKKPSLISWFCRFFGEVSLVKKVPAHAFYPPPKVDSAVLVIDINPQNFPEESIKNFFKLLEKAYKKPRKTLWNNLSPFYSEKEKEFKEFLKEEGCAFNIRAHQLDINQWKLLFNLLLNS